MSEQHRVTRNTRTYEARRTSVTNCEKGKSPAPFSFSYSEILTPMRLARLMGPALSSTGQRCSAASLAKV